MSRKLARDVGMRLIFAKDINEEEELSSVLNLMEEIKSDDLNEDDMAYIDRVVKGVAQTKLQLDDTINHFAVRWKTDRMSKVDLCILRLALYEMMYEEDIPIGVSVNEAVELSHQYSSDEAGSFINGILGQYSRSLSRH